MHALLQNGSVTADLTSTLRERFELCGDTRGFTDLRESGRSLVAHVTPYGGLDRAAREIAAWLAGRPESTSPVLLLFEPGVDFWRAFLGCVYAGVTAVPAPLPQDGRSMDRLAGILRDADCSLVLTTATMQEPIHAGIAELGLARTVTTVAVDGDRLASADDWTAPRIDAGAVAFLQYTSGSTGDPKGVAVTHDNVLHNTAAIADALGLDDASVIVGWIPHFHDMGLISQLAGFLLGASVVTMSPLAFLKQPIRLLRAIHDYRGTATAAPNFAYDVIARRVTPEQLSGLDLSCCTVALNGAEPVRRRTLERVTEVLAPAGFAPNAMRPAYGIAESTLLVAFSADGPNILEADRHALEHNRFQDATGIAESVTLVSSGHAVLGAGITIVDPDTGLALPEDHVGEIWLSGESVAAGYHNRPLDTARQFAAHAADGSGPFLRTGDLGLLHDGQLYVTGRRKDLLIVAGRNIYPQDVEDAVQDAHVAVAGSRGVAVSIDGDDTERLLVIQAVRPEMLGDHTFDDVAASVRRCVARRFDIAAPTVVLVDRKAIHLTTSGKVQRASMRSAFLDDSLNGVLHSDVAASPAPPHLATTPGVTTT